MPAASTIHFEYLKTEQQLELISDTKAVRNYQDTGFRSQFFKAYAEAKENLGAGAVKRISKFLESFALANR